jgi:hypothetical protein
MPKSPSPIPISKSHKQTRSPLLAFSVIAALGIGAVWTGGAFETDESGAASSSVSAQPGSGVPAPEIKEINLHQKSSPGVAPQDPGQGMAPAQDYGDPSADQGVQPPDSGDPALSDPAFDDPAFDDPAFDDPAFDDPAFDDPAWDTEGGYYDPGVQDPSYTDPYQPPAADPTFQDPAFQDPNLNDQGLYDQGLNAPTASPTPVPDGQAIEGQPQDVPAAQPDLQTQPGAIPPGEPWPPGANTPENPDVQQNPTGEFPQGETQNETPSETGDEQQGM